jgi:hypothetical protein
MPIFYNDMPLNKAFLLNQMSDPTVGNAPFKEPDPVPWSPTDHPVFMPPEDMYMITGDYPNFDQGGNPLKKDGTDVFQSRNAQLVEKLQEMKRTNPKINWEEAKGRYNSKDEQSLLVSGIPVSDVVKLAKEHGQESFVHLPPYPQANRMVYVNGPHVNEHEHGIRENTKTYLSAPSNNFTFLPSLGKYLQLDFNWGNYHPNESQDSCPDDTGGPQGEPAMKSEKSVNDAVKAIAELLKKEIRQYEDFLVELRKADKCGECGKSPCACKGVKKCSKCGDMMTKMDKCSKCDMSGVTHKHEQDIVEVAQFLAVANALVKAEKSTEDSAPLSLTDKEKGGKGIKDTPKSKVIPQPGSGGDINKGKLAKAVHSVKGEAGPAVGAAGTNVPKLSNPAKPAGKIPSAGASKTQSYGGNTNPMKGTAGKKVTSAPMSSPMKEGTKVTKFEEDVKMFLELAKSFDNLNGEQLEKASQTTRDMLGLVAGVGALGGGLNSPRPDSGEYSMSTPRAGASRQVNQSRPRPSAAAPQEGSVGDLDYDKIAADMQSPSRGALPGPVANAFNAIDAHRLGVRGYEGHKMGDAKPRGAGVQGVSGQDAWEASQAYPQIRQTLSAHYPTNFKDYEDKARALLDRLNSNR